MLHSVDTDSDRLDKLISELEGKDVNQLIQEGSSKLASVPSGGGAASAAPAAAAGGAAPAAEEKKEEKKEEEKEVRPPLSLIAGTLADTHVVLQESDDDMGFGLFD